MEKESVLLEKFILNSKATNAEHNEALDLLRALDERVQALKLQLRQTDHGQSTASKNRKQ